METTMPNITLYESQPQTYQIVIDTDDLNLARDYMENNSDWLFSSSFLTEIDGQIKSVFDIENDGQIVKINDFI